MQLAANSRSFASLRMTVLEKLSAAARLKPGFKEPFVKRGLAGGVS